MKSIISTCQGETFRAAAQSPWSGPILLVTHSGWYLETERGDILLLHDVRFGEIPIGAALGLSTLSVLFAVLLARRNDKRSKSAAADRKGDDLNG